jgi:hypothetical protein
VYVAHAVAGCDADAGAGEPYGDHGGPSLTRTARQ